MWWIAFIITVMFLIFISFHKERNQQVIKKYEEEGVKSRYKELIENIMSGNPTSYIANETSSKLNIVNPRKNYTETYTLVPSFGKITVHWKFDSSVFGNHTKYWTFEENEDQVIIFEKILDDLIAHQDKLFSENPVLRNADRFYY